MNPHMLIRFISILLISSISSVCIAQSLCKNSPSAKYSFKTRIEKTNDKKLVWDATYESKRQATYGIANLSFYKAPSSNTLYLDVALLGKVKNIEYEANVEKVIEEKIYEASPGGTLIGTTILLGLPLIFSPGKTFDNAFGCTEEVSSKFTASQTNRVPTGNEEWADFSPDSVRLRITTSEGSSFEESLTTIGGTISVKVEDLILSKSKGLVNIKVLCLTCTNLKNDDLGVTFLDSKNIVLDLNQIRAVEAENKKKLDVAAMAAKKKADEDRARMLEERKKATDRAAQAKAESLAKAQAAEQKILDSYKEKCSKLGFKIGTDAFGKCVLQLTK
jgi:hypothetical protein